MTPSAANYFFNISVLPQDYKRYSAVSWNDNLTGFTEAELYESISYSQYTFSYVINYWL
jgi:hypothetical protein